ncbi:MAG: hypothetical protein KatS3mg003_1809 [Candidatus Nitrosocaldaceae archaeon]|nr:MAG: hypothetical protein KatS3mg003_1809 [Candidatus Nitrosocaldaceae archaeon]
MALVDSLIIWIHLVATSIWVGGSIFIGIVVGPYLRNINMNPKERTIFIVNLGRRFNKIALPSLFILFATGIYNARFFIINGNLDSTYGIILIIKVILVISMTLAYIIHVRVLWNRLEDNLDRYDQASIDKLRGKIINIGRLTVILSVVILLLAAILDSGL